MSINKTSKIWEGPAKSETYLDKRNAAPSVSALMVQNVSEYRKNVLSDEVNAGIYKDGSGPTIKNEGLTTNSVVTSSVGFKKHSQVISGGGGGGGSFNFRGPGDTAKQTPEVYSPLWLNSNLSLPRDRATINAWCRSFFALNPFVHNAISLHSTYPISKLNIKCPNKDIEKFFNDMIEEIDLMNICVQIAQEYWLLGESFVYAELDQSKGKWSRLLIQNPDYMVVKRTVVASEPIIMLKPDENLKTVVRSNRPSDIEQRKQLNQHIIDSVKRGDNIPLNNFHVSHLARRISPYEIRGTGLPVCIFRQLMLFDKLRESKFAQADNMINPLTLIKIGSEGVDGLHPTHPDLEAWREVFECHDDITEVLTNQGFKKYSDVMETSDDVLLKNPLGQKLNAKINKNIKIACLNQENNKLEYHQAIKAHLYDYSGDMYHYKNDKIDMKVTPNHDLWVSEKEYEYNGNRSLRKSSWGAYKKIKAKDLKLTDYKRFQSKINYEGNDDVKYINVCGKNVPVETYLEFLGYLLSEGCLYTNNKSQYTTGITQSFDKYQKDMSLCIENFMSHLDKTYSNTINKRKHINPNHSDIWNGVISGKDLYLHFKENIGDLNGNVKAPFKQISRDILNLSPRLLKILLNALVAGDGSTYKNPKQNSNRFAYYTTSKQLADNVYEIAYKCGYVPTQFVRDDEKYINRGDHKRLPLYTLLWSETTNGNNPIVYKTSRNSKTKVKNNLLNIEKYNGKIWCLTVPTGLFITRRNGKITIQGNSAQYDKDFKIFTHPGVTVERVGYGQGIYDISGDITQLIKEIYVGLMVPSVLMDGGADTTYANGGVALDVLRQRYMQFRNMLSSWLKRKIFAPISKIQGFYDYAGGEKQLIVPDVDWNHMSLFDAGDYINNLVTLTQGDENSKRASLHTLYRSMGLEWQDETRKMRKEAIQKAISDKEKVSLTTMDLNSLRALGEDDEIPEPQTEAGAGGGLPGAEPLPGESPLPGMPGLGGPPPGGGEPPGGAPPGPGGLPPAP